MKWYRKVLCVAITESPVLKNKIKQKFRCKFIVCTSPTHDGNCSLLKKKKKEEMIRQLKRAIVTICLS